MSRYLILVLLNIPLITAGLLSATVAYKMHRIGKRRFALRSALWLAILLGLAFAEPIYSFLFSRNLTETEPLSLFDVIQITGIVFVIFIVSQAYAKVYQLEHKIHELHQEVSIRLSDKSKSSEK